MGLLVARRLKSAVRGQRRRASLREAKPQPQAQESHFFTSQRRRLLARAAAGTRVSLQLDADGWYDRTAASNLPSAASVC